VSLTGTSIWIPYLALSSISKGNNFYWAKALLLKTTKSFYGVQFSTDGALLIAHSYSSTGFIVVFDSRTGNIMSARSYSPGSNVNYKNRIRSIIVSAGTNASPMAYVLTNYQTTSLASSCTGQHLFKFDPLIFSTVPVWRRKTIGSLSGNDCGHLGLIFGRSESLLYAFSWYNG
jgi:hypothetical protein